MDVDADNRDSEASWNYALTADADHFDVGQSTESEHDMSVSEQDDENDDGYYFGY